MQKIQFRISYELYDKIQKEAGEGVSVDKYLRNYVESRFSEDDYMLKTQRYLVEAITKISLMNQASLQEILKIDDDDFGQLMMRIVETSDNYLNEKGLSDE